MRQSQILLAPTGDAVTVIGEPIAVQDSRRFTVAIHATNLTGTVTIEASLTHDPEPIDWFPILEPLVYPREDRSATTNAIGLSFTGRYALIRARLNRPGLEFLTTTDGQLGFVDRILLGRRG